MTAASHPPLGPPSRLIDSLRQADAANRLGRKILVAPSINWARELLRQLARRTGGCVGWEPATLRGLADDLAFVPLHDAGRRSGSDIEVSTLVGLALDQAVTGGALSPHASQLAQRAGFRQAIVDGILELRVAGVSPAALRAAGDSGPGAALGPVLERYLVLLEAQPFTDAAGVFEAALAAFDAEAPLQLGGRLLLAPGLVTRGLPGRLLERLFAHGGSPLVTEEPAEPAPRGLEIFIAGTPADEVREALRRAVEEGYRLDQVELVTTDPDSYGIALDGLARHLDFSATMLLGVPLARSRVGRALDRWLSWLEEGLPADHLRQLIESSDLALADASTDSATLARSFRALKIGWGRARTESGLAELRDSRWVNRRLHSEEPLDEDELKARRARLAQEAGDLALLLERLLAITPPVPEPGQVAEPQSSVSALARAAIAFLDLAPSANGTDNGTATRLRNRLTRVAELSGVSELPELADPPRPFRTALAELREILADVKVWTDASGSQSGWSSKGGAVHLVDLKHAGLTGRPRTFVLGLDADRAGGPRLPDPLLPERVRERLGPETIATTAIRRKEAGELVAATIAGLRGRVTLSFATASDLAGHEAGPAPVLLEIARRDTGQPDLGYTELRQRLGAPACAVPAPGRGALDGRDGWFTALTDGPLLLDGTRQVLRGWPGLAGGIAAFAALEQLKASPHLGLVTAAAGLFDPTGSDHSISASSLELLGKCPLAWFYRYVLKLELPDDPEYDPSRWLDALQRGSLLHEVYEQFVRRHLASQSKIPGAAAAAALESIVTAQLAEWVREVPPPNGAAYDAEAREIRASARSFLDMERTTLRDGTAGRWETPEQFIDPRAVRYALPDGSSFPVKGRIDRIDRLQDETLLVVDYKTGGASHSREDPKQGLFRGARLLQPAIYAAAAAQQFRAQVSRFEYRFPTLKGENQRSVYPAQLLDQAPALILDLLRHVRNGEFVPTNDNADCTYCDFGPICRVREAEGWGGVSSPRAKWAEQAGEFVPSVMAMARRRQ